MDWNIDFMCRSRGIDRRGSIEGLPLQLMIIILIAGMATAVMVGWMGNIETPHSIGDVDITVSEENTELPLVESSDSISFDIHVYDQDGNPLENAAVILSGLGVSGTADAVENTFHAITDSDGVAKFTDVSVHMNGASTGYIHVNVSKSGYGENISSRLMVVA